MVNSLEIVLYIIFFASCFALIAAVLLQPGKTDAGALFTSNVSSSAFAPRGTATVLSKVTIAAAALFMLSALFLAMPAVTGNVSVLSSNPDAPASTDTNTNTVPTNSNGALIETPATEQLANQAANAAAASSGPANASVSNSAGSANSSTAANAANKAAVKPTPKK